MKDVLQWLSLVVALFTGLSVLAQTTREEVKAALLPVEGKGISPANVYELVMSSDLIVIGSWGEKIRSHSFYGYGETPESLLSRTGGNGPAVLRAALPANDFIVEVDEVLMGSAPETRLTLRVIESPGVENRPEIVDFRKGRHLFFLALQPDGMTYGLQGTVYDLKEDDGGYVYLESGALRAYQDAANQQELRQEIIAIATENPVPE